MIPELEEYVREKQVQLARAIAGRARIYLDLNFWILARETAAGRETGTTECELLRLLRDGVASGEILCPISDSVFLELEKQPISEDRRIGTARIIDELSLGVAIVNVVDRISAEIRAFLIEKSGRTDTHALGELLWTRASHVLGAIEPPTPGLDPKVDLQLAKWDIDRMWQMSPTEFFHKTAKSGRQERDVFKDLSSETNAKRDMFAHEVTNFAKAYDIEVRGAIGVAGAMAATVLYRLGEENGHEAPQRGSRPWLIAENALKNILFKAIGTRVGKKALRTLHIEASLHASMRYDKARRFKANDFHDFRHAGAAIGYCDVFLTDGPLCDLATRPQLRLCDINGCHVTSDPDQAVDLLRGLNRVCRDQ